jgi:hypothetical protein
MRVHLDDLVVEVPHCHAKWLNDLVFKILYVLLEHSGMSGPHEFANFEPDIPLIRVAMRFGSLPEVHERLFWDGYSGFVFGMDFFFLLNSFFFVLSLFAFLPGFLIMISTSLAYCHRLPLEERTGYKE